MSIIGCFKYSFLNYWIFFVLFFGSIRVCILPKSVDQRKPKTAATPISRGVVSNSRPRDRAPGRLPIVVSRRQPSGGLRPYDDTDYLPRDVSRRSGDMSVPVPTRVYT